MTCTKVHSVTQAVASAIERGSTDASAISVAYE